MRSHPHLRRVLALDLDDEARPVYQLANGREISELDPAARQWNATALDGGTIVVGARRPPAGEPAARR